MSDRRSRLARVSSSLPSARRFLSLYLVIPAASSISRRRSCGVDAGRGGRRGRGRTTERRGPAAFGRRPERGGGDAGGAGPEGSGVGSLPAPRRGVWGGGGAPGGAVGQGEEKRAQRAPV